ncbi:MAG: hypothetical protein ACXVK3_15365 [Candidatus Angelobacter sp.]
MPVGNSSAFGTRFFCSALAESDRQPNMQMQPSKQNKRAAMMLAGRGQWLFN